MLVVIPPHSPFILVFITWKWWKFSFDEAGNIKKNELHILNALMCANFCMHVVWTLSRQTQTGHLPLLKCVSMCTWRMRAHTHARVHLHAHSVVYRSMQWMLSMHILVFIGSNNMVSGERCCQTILIPTNRTYNCIDQVLLIHTHIGLRYLLLLAVST